MKIIFFGNTSFGLPTLEKLKILKKKTWFKQKIFSKNSKDKTNRDTKAFE